MIDLVSNVFCLCIVCSIHSLAACNSNMQYENQKSNPGREGGGFKKNCSAERDTNQRMSKLVLLLVLFAVLLVLLGLLVLFLLCFVVLVLLLLGSKGFVLDELVGLVLVGFFPRLLYELRVRLVAAKWTRPEHTHNV